MKLNLINENATVHSVQREWNDTHGMVYTQDTLQLALEIIQKEIVDYGKSAPAQHGNVTRSILYVFLYFVIQNKKRAMVSNSDYECNIKRRALFSFFFHSPFWTGETLFLLSFSF